MRRLAARSAGGRDRRGGAGDGADLDPVERAAAIGARGDDGGDGLLGGRAPQVVEDDVDVRGDLADAPRARPCLSGRDRRRCLRRPRCWPPDGQLSRVAGGAEDEHALPGCEVDPLAQRDPGGHGGVHPGRDRHRRPSRRAAARCGGGRRACTRPSRPASCRAGRSTGARRRSSARRRRCRGSAAARRCSCSGCRRPRSARADADRPRARGRGGRAGSPVRESGRFSFAVQNVLGRVAAAHDLSITQLRMLAILRDREPGMLELARQLELSKSSASGLIDRAQKRGLVARSAARPTGAASSSA